jgi:hypothetical protein
LIVLKLSEKSFTTARDYIYQQGRRLDQALFAFHFEAGPVADALTELAHYQNPDGGFGHGLEPDFCTEASSGEATAMALHVFGRLGVSVDEPAVQRAIQYLLKTYDGLKGGWAIAPPEVNQAPHAPWWHYDPAAGKASPETPVNPTAELAAGLYPFARLLPPSFLERITEHCLSYLEAQPDPMNMEDLACLCRLAEVLAPDVARRTWPRLERAVLAVVARDPADWSRYGPQPLRFILSPASPLVSSLASELDTNLDYRIESQAPDGSWAPNWSWGDFYPDAWLMARLEWQSALTLETLLILQRFGRVG